VGAVLILAPGVVSDLIGIALLGGGYLVDRLVFNKASYVKAA
jgi:UPF0716 family protein affecting phage T7 exclusion